MFYDNASKTSVFLLDWLKYQCLQLCLGALTSTPTVALSVEGKVPPLVIRRCFFVHCYAFKLVSLKKNTFRVFSDVDRKWCFSASKISVLRFGLRRLRPFQNHIFQFLHTSSKILPSSLTFLVFSFLYILLELYSPALFSNINSIFNGFINSSFNSTILLFTSIHLNSQCIFRSTLHFTSLLLLKW